MLKSALLFPTTFPTYLSHFWALVANPPILHSVIWVSFFYCSSFKTPLFLNSFHLLCTARSRLRKAASTSSRSTRLCCGAALSKWLSRSSERLESVRLSRQMLCSSSPARAVLWRMGGQVVRNLGIHRWAQLLVPHYTRCVRPNPSTTPP